MPLAQSHFIVIEKEFGEQRCFFYFKMRSRFYYNWRAKRAFD